MTISWRRTLGVLAISVPTITAAISGLAGYWTIAALSASILGGILGVMLLMTLATMRAVMRNSKLATGLQRRTLSRVSELGRESRDSVAQLQRQFRRVRSETSRATQRLEHAERRVLGLLETVRLERTKHDEYLAELRNHLEPGMNLGQQESSGQTLEIGDLSTAFEPLMEEHLRRSRSTLVARLRSIAMDETQQVEALLQLYSKVEPRAPMPPLGHWAMDARSLLHLSHLCARFGPRSVLELGGGTSTIWLGYLLEASGARVTAIEHDANYAKLTNESLERHGLDDCAALRTAPLSELSLSGRTFNWYDPGSFDGLREIDMLIVDGPPASGGTLARFPALPMLHNRLAPNCVVVLDDTHRRDEMAILERWLQEFPDFTRIDDGVSRLGVLRREG